MLDGSSILLPKAQGRKASKASAGPQIEVRREIGEEDLATLLGQRPEEPSNDVDLAEGQVPAVLESIARIRHSHHVLAQHLAKGATVGEASLLTGYSIAWISTLQRDPQFAELLRHYESVREVVFADAIGRMKILGLSALDELQHRLDTEPEKWGRKELVEMADKMLNGSRGPSTGLAGSTNSAGVTISVNFVNPKKGNGSSGAGPIIELDSKEV